MQDEKNRPDDEDARALERERLGGPADYDEAGGTGLAGGGDSRTGSEWGSGASQNGGEDIESDRRDRHANADRSGADAGAARQGG